jgi:hypothetical protein
MILHSFSHQNTKSLRINLKTIRSRMARAQPLFSVTICAKRKPGMGEDEYHRYISETHAPLLKRLLVEKKIVDYTMVRNLRFLPDA